MPTGVDFRSDTCTLWDYFTHKISTLNDWTIGRSQATCYLLVQNIKAQTNEQIKGFSSMKVPKPLMYLQDHFPEAINLEFTSNN